MAAIPENTQRVLDKIAPVSQEYEFYLAGGTGCAIHLEHRVSKDIDLFSENEFHPDYLRKKVEDCISLENVSIESNTLNADVEGVGVSFLWFPYPLIEELSEYHSVKVASLTDIGLMKLAAIGSRGSRRDFIDLYFITMQHRPLMELFKLMPEKFGSINITHILRSLVYFKDADGDATPQMIRDISWVEIKGFFEKRAKELLEEYIGGPL